VFRKFYLSFALATLLCSLPLTANAATPRVVATIPPIHSLVAMILEGIAVPDLIVKGFASPHDYAMAPSDASKVAHADIIFWTGPELEGFLVKSINNLGATTRVIALGEAEPSEMPTDHVKAEHKHEHDGHDPHFWLSPARAAQALEHIATALSEMLPTQRQQISTNKEAALAALTALEAEIRGLVEPIRSEQAVVLHDAYNQFTEHFGLKSFMPLSVTPEHRPGPAQLKKIRHAIKEHNIRCVFREPQYPKRYTALLIEGSTAREGTLDPLGGGLTPGAKLYTELMTGLATSLRNCMKP